MKASDRLTAKEIEEIENFIKIHMTHWYRFMWKNMKNIDFEEIRSEYTALYVNYSFTCALEFISDFMVKDTKEFLNAIEMFKDMLNQVENGIKEDMHGK